MENNVSNAQLCGNFIRTYKGNLLCCVSVGGRPFFFAMTPDGKRFLFANETKRGMYLNRKEWDYAFNNWDDARIEPLTGNDLMHATALAPEIANNFLYGMTSDQRGALPSNHVMSF